MNSVIWFDAYSKYALPIILQTKVALRLSVDQLIVNCYEGDNLLIDGLVTNGIKHIIWDYRGVPPVKNRYSLIVSIFARRVIPSKFILLAQYGGLNIHPSLLPIHRGCFAIPWALIDGDSKTGLTVHTLSHPVDTGLLFYSKEWEICKYDTALSLHLRFLNEAILLYPEIISRYLKTGEKGSFEKFKSLSPEKPAHPRILPYNGDIQEGWDDSKVERFIRAMYYPPFNPASYKGNSIYTFEQYVKAKS